jgi:hypothetical protein
VETNSLEKNIKSGNIENVLESEILRSVPLQGNWNSHILVIPPGKSVKWPVKSFLKMETAQMTCPSCRDKTLSPMKVDIPLSSLTWTLLTIDHHSDLLRSRPESIKLENSPKTPPLSLQSQTFLTASQTQRSPPRSMPPLDQHEQTSTIINLDHLPPYQDYNFTINYSATTPLRPQYEDRDQTFDPSIFSQVNQVP